MNPFDDVLGGDFEDGYNDGLAGNKDRYMAGSNSDEYNRGYRDGASGKQGNPILGAALQIYERGRLTNPFDQRFEIVETDVTPWTFTPGDVGIIGADEEIIDGPHPFFDTLRGRWRSAVGRPKMLRVDNEESYAEFRAIRRQPHVDTLDARLRRLELAFEQHVSDHHGPRGSDVAAFEAMLDGHEQPDRTDEYNQAVLSTVVNTARGGHPLDLPLREGFRSEGWLDGDEVLVTIARPAGYLTTGCVCDDTFIALVSCAEQVGCDKSQAMMVGASLAPRVVARQLLGALADIIIDGPVKKPIVGVLSPNVDTSLAAAMALLQKAQRGDRKAAREALKLANGAGRKLMKKAQRQLEKAQAWKDSQRGRA